MEKPSPGSGLRRPPSPSVSARRRSPSPANLVKRPPSPSTVRYASRLNIFFELEENEGCFLPQTAVLLAFA